MLEFGSKTATRNAIVILVLLLEIGACVAFYFYKYVPMQAEIERKEEIVEEKKRDVREIEMTKRLLTETREEIERLKSDIARLEKFFPQEVFIPRVLVLIENLAMATHVDIQYLKPRAGGRAAAASQQSRASSNRRAAPAPATGKTGEKTVEFNSSKEYSQSNIDFKINGSFQNIYNFMNELATFPKLVVVDRLSLNQQQSQTDETGATQEGSAETGLEIEVGGYVEVSADLPLTFYIQKQDSSKMLSNASGQEASAQ